MLDLLANGSVFFFEYTDPSMHCSSDRFDTLTGSLLTACFQIDDAEAKDQQTKMLPENSHGMQDSRITSIVLTTDFLIFTNDVSFAIILFLFENDVDMCATPPKMLRTFVSFW